MLEGLDYAVKLVGLLAALFFATALAVLGLVAIGVVVAYARGLAAGGGPTGPDHLDLGAGDVEGVAGFGGAGTGLSDGR